MQQPSSITADIPLSPFAGEAPDMFFGLPMAMARAMALRGERIGHDMAQVRMRFQADQANSRGEVHGGSIATLLDCTPAAAAGPQLSEIRGQLAARLGSWNLLFSMDDVAEIIPIPRCRAACPAARNRPPRSAGHARRRCAMPQP